MTSAVLVVVENTKRQTAKQTSRKQNASAANEMGHVGMNCPGKGKGNKGKSGDASNKGQGKGVVVGFCWLVELFLVGVGSLGRLAAGVGHSWLLLAVSWFLF